MHRHTYPDARMLRQRWNSQSKFPLMSCNFTFIGTTGENVLFLLTTTWSSDTQTHFWLLSYDQTSGKCQQRKCACMCVCLCVVVEEEEVVMMSLQAPQRLIFMQENVHLPVQTTCYREMNLTVCVYVRFQVVSCLGESWGKFPPRGHSSSHILTHERPFCINNLSSLLCKIASCFVHRLIHNISVAKQQ